MSHKSSRLVALAVGGIMGVASGLGASGQDLANPGPFQVQQTNVNFDTPGAGITPALLYYPTSGGGLVDPTLSSYHGIVLSHGFLQSASRYHSTMVHLASHGYFVLGIDSQTGLFPDHQEFVDSVRASMDYFTTLNGLVGTTFFNRINTSAFGLVGHSLGGGVSIVEAVTDPRVKAVVGLAPADTFTNPTAKNAIGNMQAPIRMLVGTDDLIASLGNSTQPLYNNAQDPKQLMILQGAGHGGYEDSSSFPDTGSMPRAEQLEISRRETTTFMNFYLKGDQSVWRDVWGPEVPASANISSVQLDSGMNLQAAVANQVGIPGQATTYSVTLTNTSRWASTFDVLAEDQAWSTVISSPTTGVLAPGQATTFSVTVTPPAGEFNALDRVLLSTRSGHDGLTRQYTYLTTTTGEGTELATASVNNRSVIQFDTADNEAVLKGPVDGLATPLDVKYDAAGNYYIVDTALNRVTKYDPSGNATIVASAANGLLFPTSVAIDGTGNLYVSSYLNNQVIKVAPGGATTVLGTAASGLDNPFGLTVDGAGNVYVASLNNHSVIKIDTLGNSSVFADLSDGLFTPIDVKIAANGQLYVADALRGMIFSFTPAGDGTVFADRDDGINIPSGMAFDHAGNLFVSNYLANTILKITPSGIGSVVADAADGLDSPFGLAETVDGIGGFALEGFARVESVPEASSLSLLATSALGLIVVGFRRRALGTRRPAASPSQVPG